MKEYRDWFIEHAGSMTIEDIRQISRLIQWYERSEEELGNSQYDASLNAAMLADISEAIFGENAKDAPSLLSYPHAGWACGPGQKLKDESYVRAFYKLRTRDSLTPEQRIKANAWESFVKSLYRQARKATP